METFWKKAQTFMEIINAETGFPVLIYDDTGHIVKATDTTRIGDLHAGAKKILAGEVDEYAVTAEEAKANPLVREGYSCPIAIQGRRVSGIGITGKLALVKPLARIAARLIHTWLQDLDHQEQLRRSEQKYKSIFNNSSNGIFQSTIEGRLITANSSLAEICGYASPEAMTGEITDISRQLYLDPNDREALKAKLFGEKKVSGFITRFRHLSGKTIEVRINAHQMIDTDSGQTILEGIVEDITETVRKTQELQFLKNYLNTIINTMPSVLIGVDHRCTVTQMNLKAREKSVIAPESAEGVALTTAFPGLSPIAETVIQSLRSGEIRQIPRYITASGSRQLYEAVTVYPVTVDGFEGAVIRIDDISDQVAMEKLMLRTEKMMSIGGLAAGMAHEINNPLGAVIQTADVLKQRLFGNLPANTNALAKAGLNKDSLEAFLNLRNISGLLENIHSSGLRASRIISNMLDFARANRAGHTNSPPAQLVDRTLELIKKSFDPTKKIDFRKIRIIRDYSPDIPEIRCDPGEIQQVLLNLLNNAAQILNSMGGRDKDPTITIHLSSEDDAVLIAIHDNGPGISPETCEHIFEPFFTTKSSDQGTGLGLPVSRHIIENNHKGTLGVESSPETGTSFIIRLPGVNPKPKTI